MINVVNFSGGRTSAYLVYLFEQKRKNLGVEVEYIYCDTGAEHPETYKFINRVVSEWGIELTCLRTVITNKYGVGPTYKVVKLSDCKPDLQPFYDVIKKHGTPTVAAPLCSDRMKSIPADKYCNEKYGKDGYVRWLGIRVDEQNRIKTTEQQLRLFEKVKRTSGRAKGIRYLADISDFEKIDILNWWKNNSFDLQLDEHLGNCVFCIKKGANKLALSAMDEPEMAVKFIDMVNSSDVAERPTRGLPPDIMYRGNNSLESIIESYRGVSREEILSTIRGSGVIRSETCSESCEAFGSQPDLFYI